jgi:hypothetical protein
MIEIDFSRLFLELLLVIYLKQIEISMLTIEIESKHTLWQLIL